VIQSVRCALWSFKGSVFKWPVNEKERFAEAVISGSTYISCRSFLTSEKILQFEVNARVPETTSLIFSLTTDTASLRTANWIENLEASALLQKCFFTASKFSAHTHACSRDQQFLTFYTKIKILLVGSLLYFTIDAASNVEVYHKIIIFRGTECTWPWARLEGGLRAIGIRYQSVATPKLAARFSPKMRKRQHQIESAEQHCISQYFSTFFGFRCSDVHTL